MQDKCMGFLFTWMVAQAISPEGAVHNFPLSIPTQQSDNDSAAVPDSQHKKGAWPLHYQGFY